MTSLDLKDLPKVGRTIFQILLQFLMYLQGCPQITLAHFGPFFDQLATLVSNTSNSSSDQMFEQWSTTRKTPEKKHQIISQRLRAHPKITPPFNIGAKGVYRGVTDLGDVVPWTIDCFGRVVRNQPNQLLTPARTLSIRGLKSRVLKLPFQT